MKLIDVSTPKYPNTFAMVDDADFDWLNQWKWTFCQYAIRWEQHKNIKRKLYMHSVVNNTPSGLVTDHIDGNGLNNQRLNLRSATRNQNCMNRSSSKTNTSSVYKGVSWDKREKKWYAYIKTNGKRKSLGGFKNEADAAMAYNKAAPEAHGEYARLNFIGKGFGA